MNMEIKDVIEDQDDDLYACPAPNLTCNGCSFGISWFYRTFLGRPPVWECFCDVHDYAYGSGITAKDRLKADRQLRKCIQAYAPIKATIFYVGLRLFGWIWFYIK